MTLRRVTSLELLAQDEKSDWLQTATVIWLGEGKISPSLIECTWI